MRPLPAVMVAPNGARLTKADHPNLPVTIEELIATAKDCAAAGADGIHAHMRDDSQRHTLDAGLYTEFLREMDLALPEFYVQITSEAVGQYTPAEQRRLVEALRPKAVSIALREILAGQDKSVTQEFFAGCADAGVGVQHILYDAVDIEHFSQMIASGVIPERNLKALLVIGRYEGPAMVTPERVTELAGLLRKNLPGADWAVCAFGKEETACLLQARALGGKVRIGFENNRLNPDGTVAATNAERVANFLAAAAQGEATPTNGAAA